MSGPGQPGQAHKIRIASAADLFNALRSDLPSLRLFVLKAIADNPEKALSYGVFQGANLREEAVTHWQRTGINTEERAIALAAIVALGGDATLDICKSEFSFSRNRDVLRIAASRLASEPVERVGDFLPRFLFDDKFPVRARLAATLMSGFSSLSPRERLRVAIISMNQNTPLPPLPEPDTEGLWVSELNGIWAEEAKAMAEGMGEEAFRRLARTWDVLSEEVKLWLIEWGMRGHIFHATGLVADVLRSNNVKLVLVALRCLGQNKTAGSFFQTLLNVLVHHSEPAVRVAAIEAGGTAEDPLIKRMLAAETPEVRLALIGSIARSKDSNYTRDLTDLIRDRDWRIRAAACDALAEMGGSIIETLKPFLADRDGTVRVAAMRTLLAVGGESLVVASMPKN